MSQREIRVLVQRPAAPRRDTSISQLQIQRYIGVCLFGPDCIAADIEVPVIEEREEDELLQTLVEMTPATDVLQVLQEDGIQELLKVLENELPHTAVIYNWIKKQTEWVLKLPHTKVQIMCPDGDWSDGTVVATVEGLSEGSVFGSCYSMDAAGTRLKKALVETKLIPWQKFSHFSGVHSKNIPAVVEALREIGLPLQYNSLYVPCHIQYLSAEEAASVEVPECPENVRLGSLDLSHLDTVCKYWPHYSPDYRPVVESMITLNPSCGVFVRAEDGSEQLAAMILQSEYGGLGLLQTVPEFRRRGFALLVLRHQTRTLGRAGVNVHCHVIVNNFSSLELFKRSGLKTVALSNWICIEPKSHQNSH